MSLLTTDTWNDMAGLVHGFLSRGPTGDFVDGHDWTEQLGVRELSAVTVVVPRQVHGTHIQTVSAALTVKPEADGLLTATAGIIVGVVTADCVPLLLAAQDVRVAAVAHAGWRGTLAGIVPAVVRATAVAANRPASELRAAIGPAIGGCCYEVGHEVRSAFDNRYGSQYTAPAFVARNRRPYLDLRLFVQRQLETAGLAHSAIDVVGPCTACDRVYASYRRDGSAQPIPVHRAPATRYFGTAHPCRMLESPGRGVKGAHNQIQPDPV